jgi:hypothetical protein
MSLVISFRGNFQPGIPFEHRTSTEHQIAVTLEKMGHTVHRLQENAVDWATVEVIGKTSDMFLWTQTWNIDEAGARRALTALRRAKVPSVAFHLDLYWGLERAHQITDYPWWKSSFVFTADGGHQDEFHRAGVNHHWLTPAIFEDEAVRGTPDRETFAWPVVFVGSYPYPHPEHADARRTLIQVLQGRYGGSLRVYRAGIRGKALGDLYATASVVVGDSCLAGSSPRYWSDRIPETLGRGGFLVHPYVEGIEQDYTDGQHLRFFEPQDYRQLVTLIDYYLGHSDERERIGADGQAHVLAHHTYRHRMATLLDTVFPEEAPGQADETMQAWTENVEEAK